jgi:copper chaperone CopZ
MQNRRSYFSRKIGLLAIAVFIAATVAVAFGGYKAAQKETAPQTGTEINPAQIPPPADRDLTKVILNVKDMSCSGCISTIKGSLSGIRGIEDVVVDLGGGRAEVYYDHKVLKDVSVIAGAITESGYPADILRTIPPDEIRRERALAAAKAQTYIASVSGRDIARADFNAELGIAKK